MKKLLALEELAQLILTIYVYFQLPLHISWYWLVPVFFYPDLFAIGFLFSNQLGTIMYNLSHLKFLAIVIAAIGFFVNSNVALQLGIIMYAHICFDRSIGYGLKYLGNPNKTHLGFIGKEKYKNAVDSF